MSGISRRSMSSPAIGKQMRPRPYKVMKFMSSGVTSSAAIVRSPSFSRSSSSQTMTIFPALISSIISSMVLNGIFHSPLGSLRIFTWSWHQQPLHILGYNVRLQVHPVSRPEVSQVCHLFCLRQYRDDKRRLLDGDEGEADPVNTYTPPFDAVSEDRFGRRKLPDFRPTVGPNIQNLPYAVYVSLDDVPAEPRLRGHRPLQVNDGALFEPTQRRAAQSFGHRQEDEHLTLPLVDRKAHTVNRDGVADPHIFGQASRDDAEAYHAPPLHKEDYAACPLNQPRKHDPPLRGKA